MNRRTSMRILLGALLIALSEFALPFSKVEAATPLLTGKVVQKIEANLRMPRGARPLSQYNRFYTAADVDSKGLMKPGTKGVWGAFILENEAHGDSKIHIVSFDKMPEIMDGGCGIVNIWFDLRTQKVVSATCNGLA